ncbi:hypothetical protein TELCIR_15874, partial [Teladorsagia circumcincta]
MLSEKSRPSFEQKSNRESLDLKSSFPSNIIEEHLQRIGGLQRTFTQDAMIDYAKERILVQVPNYVFYMLPMISSVFYLFAYRSLRSKRGSVTSGVTKSLLDKAEKCNLKTGIWILALYL